MPLARSPLLTVVRLPGRWMHHRAGAWARASQQGSRRNAMIAATRLAQRRVEADEISLYLAAHPLAAARSLAEAPERVAHH